MGLISDDMRADHDRKVTAQQQQETQEIARFCEKENLDGILAVVREDAQKQYRGGKVPVNNVYISNPPSEFHITEAVVASPSCSLALLRHIQKHEPHVSKVVIGDSGDHRYNAFHVTVTFDPPLS